MGYEVKRVDIEFVDKYPQEGNMTTLLFALQEAEKTILSCNDSIESAGLAGISYTSQSEKIEDAVLDGGILMSYVSEAQDEVYSELDKKLYTGFKNGATETISNIKAEDITTENTFHMEEYTEVNWYGKNVKYKQEKSSLTFEDFLGINKITEDEEIGALQNVVGMQEFSSMFQEDYDKMVAEGQLDGSGIDDLDEYLSQLMEIGEFDHKEYHPVLNVLSGLLDITIVKPIIEVCTGHDMLTGEQLTDFELGMKVVFAVVDIATLGIAIGATEIAKLGVKEALMLAGKVTVHSMVSDAAAYTVGTLANELGLPLPITLMLSMGTGIKVSKTLDSLTGEGKYVIKNDSGQVLGEIAEDALDNTKNLDKLLDGSDQTLDDLVKKAGGEIDDLSVSKNLDEVIDDSSVLKNSIDDVIDEADDSILSVKKGIADGDVTNASTLDVNQNVIIDDTIDNIDDVSKNTTPDVNGSKVSQPDTTASKITGIDTTTVTKQVEEATTSVVNKLTTKFDELFDIVAETVDKGKEILFKMMDGTEVLISKAKLKAQGITEAAMEFCITGCFTGEVLVLTQEGHRRIDSIQLGDYVYATEPKTGEHGFKKVLQIQKRNACEFIRITVGDEEIRTTPSHLFYLSEGTWQAAGEIKAGDALLSAEGEIRQVTAVEKELSKEAEGIYNLTIEGYHTYYVSQMSILVHNVGCAKLSELRASVAVKLNLTTEEIKAVCDGLRADEGFTTSTIRKFLSGIEDGESSIKKVVVDGEEILSVKGVDVEGEYVVKGGSETIENTVKKVDYGDQFTTGKNDRKELKSNVEYSTPQGYNYTTDNVGRINSVDGTLTKNTAQRNPYSQKVAGREDRLPTDDGGHLIASIFDGSGDLDNLVPMDSTLNRGEWRTMENSWSKALDLGQKVKVKIEPVYNGASQRPVSFDVQYKIGDGDWVFQSFDN